MPSTGQKRKIKSQFEILSVSSYIVKKDMTKTKRESERKDVCRLLGFRSCHWISHAQSQEKERGVCVLFCVFSNVCFVSVL